MADLEDAPTAAAPARAGRAPGRSQDAIAELRFLHRLLGLATTAQTWEELLETVVDGTRDALRPASPRCTCSTATGVSLTLAATNGLDRFQIGRAVVPFGEGITGRVAASPRADGHPRRRRRPALPVGPRHRPAAVRRLDAVRAADLARPGRRRAQRPDRGAIASSRARTWRSCTAIADLLAGIVEKGRLQREAEAQVEQLQGARPGAQRARRARHARAAHAAGRGPRVHRPARRRAAPRRPLVARPGAPRHPRGLGPGHDRADRAAGPPGRLDPRVGPRRARPARPTCARSTSRRSCDDLLDELGPLLQRHHLAHRRRRARCTRGRRARGCARSWSTCWRTPSSTRRRTAASSRLGAGRRRRPDRSDRRGPGHPGGVARADLRAVRAPRDRNGPRLGHRPVRGQAAGRVDGRRLWCEPAPSRRRAVRARPAAAVAV